MITFKFDGSRKQDINCFVFPPENGIFLASVNCYQYNEKEERIEYIGSCDYYYNHEDKKWTEFNILEDHDFENNDITSDSYLYCKEIVIK